MNLNLNRLKVFLKKIFEPLRVNPISLSDDSNIDENLKPVKIGDKNSIVELSETELKIRGSIDANAITVNGISVSTEPDDDTGVITALNDATENEVVTVGATTTELDAETGLTFSDGLIITKTSGLTNHLKMAYDNSNYSAWNTASNGATSLQLAGSGGKLSLIAVTGIQLTAPGNQIFFDNNAEFGSIDMATSSHLKLIGTTNYDVSIESQGTGNVNLTSADDITIDATDSLIFDSDGTYIMKAGNTEFSATNSAYAGMILGYTRLQHDLTNSITFEIQNALTVEDSTHQITFKTPPSELVEIQATFLINATSTDTKICVGLSDSDTYNSVSAELEYDSVGVAFGDDEADDGVRTVQFVLSAGHLATIGSSNTFYIGFSTGGVTKSAYLVYGLRASIGRGEHPFIIKATALPATIYDGL